ncbi:MAG: hypothetical protein HFF50_07710 [Lawsonibacter sp.]|nr:hypothetical protein [Lawsonibacter sp.]
MLPAAVIDLHCDTLVPMEPGRRSDTLNDPNAHLSLSCLPKGVRWGQCFAIFLPDTLSREEAVAYYARHRDSFFRQMEKFCQWALPCRTAADIEAAWAQKKAAALLTVENGSVLAGDLDRVELLARDGVRMLTLTWNGANELGSGHSTDRGLTPFGREAVHALEEAGILLDVSHLNDRGLEELLSVARKPFVASHSNARAVCPHRRNLTDEQIRALVRRCCLIGLNYSVHFLREGGAGASREDLYQHILHFLELGAADCLALGSDFDGTDVPDDLDSPGKVVCLWDFLLQKGLPAELCEKIMWKNALAFFRENWTE